MALIEANATTLIVYGIRLLMALIATGSFMSWVWVWRSVGTPRLEVEYIQGVIFHPGAWIGLVMSVAFLVARQYLFSVAGPSQTFWTGAVTAVFQAFLMVLLLRTEFSVVQWVGAVMVLIGGILVVNGQTSA